MRLFFIVVSYCLLTTIAFASSKDIMLDMIEYIENNSKYVYNGERLPYIELRTKIEICETLYPDFNAEEDDCLAVGYYDDITDTIFIADSPSKYMVEEKFFEVVLFHELVHYLQDINGEYDKVECQNALEKDAYLLHRDYVRHMGWPEEQEPDMLFAMMVSMCAEEFPVP
jgi:hypothetical protein